MRRRRAAEGVLEWMRKHKECAETECARAAWKFRRVCSPIRGARAAPHAAKPNPWLQGLLARRHPNIAAVALANKNARIVWAILAHGRDYQPDFVPVSAAA